MARIIKFRGKDLLGKWRYGDLIQEKWKTKLNTNEKAFMIKKDKTAYTVLGETLGQFTGLYDKNGKEIFEGDIVKSYFENGLGVENKCLIIYDEYLCAFMGQELRTKQQYLFNEGNPNKKDKQLKYTEVIGNMYDKPVTKEQFEEIGYKIEGE